MLKIVILWMRLSVCILVFVSITVQCFGWEIITKQINGRLVKNQEKLNFIQWENGELTCGELSGDQITHRWSIPNVSPVTNLFYRCQFIGDSFYLVSDRIYRFTHHGDLIWKSERSASFGAFDSLGCVGSDYNINLYSLGPDGKMKWEIRNTYEDVWWIDDDIVISCRGLNEIYVRSRTSGDLLWKYDIKSYDMMYAMGLGIFTGLDSNNVFVCDKNTIYAAIRDELISFSRSGKINYDKKFKQPFSMAPLLDSKGLLYVATRGGLYCIDNTGNIIWSDETGIEYNCACLDSEEGRLFCGGLNNVAVYEGGKRIEDIEIKDHPQKIIYSNGIYFISSTTIGRISDEEISKNSSSPKISK